MKDFLLKRILSSIPVIFGVVTLVFLLIHIIPGDPVDMLLGDSAQAVDRDAMRNALGLNQPLWGQYINFWKNIFVGGWGQSIAHSQTVLSLLLERFPASLLLSVCALIVGILISFPLGIFAARKSGTLVDTQIMLFALLGMSVPLFVMAPIAILVLSIYLGWLPVSGMGTLSHLVLPSLCLGVGLSGILTRMIRASMLDVLGEDYIRTAASKGLSDFYVHFKHALRNALIPVVTILGIMLGNLLAGAVITETIFDWPGIGKLFFSSFQSRDYPLVQGVVLWTSMSYVFINFAVDVLYSLIDPRIRLKDPR